RAPRPVMMIPSDHSSAPLQRLGKNINGYFGEGIDLEVVLGDCVVAAREKGWAIQEMSAAPKPKLLAFTRGAASGTECAPRVYLSTGIHGDEPAGPLALRQMLQQNQWPPHLNLWLCPCLNPTGFAANRRENSDG